MKISHFMMSCTLLGNLLYALDDSTLQSMKEFGIVHEEAEKSGLLIGIEFPFMPIDSLMQVTTPLGGSGSYSVSGNMLGVGVKLGYQNFHKDIYGVRSYLNYRYMFNSIKDTKEKISNQVLGVNVDFLLDIPFNFNFQNPSSSGFGIILGVMIGVQRYYDGIYDLPISFTFGCNVGIDFALGKHHRLEFLTQFLFGLQKANISDYAQSSFIAQNPSIAITGATFSAESLNKQNIHFSVGYTYNF